MNNRGALFAQAARGPVLLIVIGTLFALQQAGILAFSRSWPLIIIAIGVMKLIERLLVKPGAPSAAPGAGADTPWNNAQQAPPPGAPPFRGPYQ